MAICCYPSAQKTSWLLLTPTSNASKSTRTPGCNQDPKIGILSSISSRESTFCQTFSTQEQSSLRQNYERNEEWEKTGQSGSSQTIRSRSTVRDDLQASLYEGLAKISAGTIKKRFAFKLILFKVFKEKLRTAVRKHGDWFDRNSMVLEELINNRNIAWNNMFSMMNKSAKAR